MKIRFILIIGIFLSMGVAKAQAQDSMYVMKNNAVVGKYATVAVDSVIFYNPYKVPGKKNAYLHWSEKSLGTDVVSWGLTGKVKVGDLPRFSKDYNWVVTGYYDDDEYQYVLEDLNAVLLDGQDVYVKVIPMKDAWANTGAMIDSVKGRGGATTERFRYVGLHIPPKIGNQAISKINKRAFYPPALDWDDNRDSDNPDVSKRYNEYIRHIFLPNTITEIGDEAFISTNALVKVEFEQGENQVTFLEDKNFHSIPFGANDKGLPWNIPGPNDPQWARTFLGNELCNTYVMPKHYNAIVEEMFRWTDPDTIVVPASVYYIGIRAFLDDDAGNNPTMQGFFDNATQRVKVIKFLGTTPPVLRRGRPPVPNPDPAANVDGSAWHIRPIAKKVKRLGKVLPDPVKIMVPASAVATYKADASWQGYEDVIVGY